VIRLGTTRESEQVITRELGDCPLARLLKSPLISGKTSL
jgi:hypothetical protein